MQEITYTQAQRILPTHVGFFEASILSASSKALRVTVHNSKGALSTNWVPKSKIKFYKLPSGNVCYLIPKFFIK